MMRSTTRHHALTSVLLLSLFAVSALAAAPPEPTAVVTLADVEKVLGGKFKARSPEPGVVFYEEDGTGYRQVNVYLWPADGKTVVNMKVHLTQQGEPVEDVAGVGDAAMYRPQGKEATAEKKDKTDELLWLSVAVHNVDDDAATKRFAIELAKRGAARL
jgi:hypothetical protein